MIYFPQLRNDALVQYPAGRTRIYRTVETLTEELRPLKSTDPGAQRIRWKMLMRGLSDSERQAVEQFHQSVEGQFRPFGFMDPFDNLLAWSTDFANAIWHKDAGIVLTPLQPDPTGGTQGFLVSNPTALSRRFYQILPVACWYQLIASVYLKSALATALPLVIGPIGNALSVPVMVGNSWERAAVRNQPAASGEEMLTGVELAPFTEVQCFGFQLEPTLVPAVYKTTAGIGGFYAACRLEHDALDWETEGVNSHSTELVVVTA
ncbi:MAG TPA: hypothetical protein VM120_28435 [Bryobacteraceae bacterium]|nr:hypothetical protein [Bryobacteraceae bacterium]